MGPFIEQNSALFVRSGEWLRKEKWLKKVGEGEVGNNAKGGGRNS